ncbi:MAG TPA: DUF3472 domain-containing protein [Anseongella sp.]
MIRKKTYLMTPFLLALLLAAVFPGSAGGLVNVVKAYRAPGESVRVPVGGNTWRSSGGEKGGRVTNQGIRDWDDGEVVFTTYVRTSRKGSLKVSLEVSVPGGTSELEISIGGQHRKLSVSGAETHLVPVGSWQLSDSGYVAISLRGLSRSGDEYAAVDALVLDGSVIHRGAAFVKNNEGNFFYWGRRGPSVHLNYELPPETNAEWFYNEVTVPPNADVEGSFFMACGFGEGYFGFQVNSDTERRVLFSVWSPYKTDNPDDIPEDQRIVLLRKGKEVHAGEFGNEGSGGQSYLRYPWKAGTTYRFLLHGKPDGKGNTSYTAFFYAPEIKQWKLIASFRRPQTSRWLTRFHSFLENFNPRTGDKQRLVYFDNQWVGDSEGNWTEITRARFTGDNTARKGYRMDYAGGIDQARFYLKNCGFFSDYIPLDTWYERPETGRKPVFDQRDSD